LRDRVRYVLHCCNSLVFCCIALYTALLASHIYSHRGIRRSRNVFMISASLGLCDAVSLFQNERVLHEVTWYMVVLCTQNLHRDGCSSMWHQPCHCCKYTTLVDIQRTHYKASHSCRTTCKNSESAQGSKE